MCADMLDLAYDRGELLEQIRDLERGVKQLGKDLFRCSCARKMYFQWYRKLLRLRAWRDILFPREFAPAREPIDILQQVYDHHHQFRFTPQQLDMMAKELLPARVQVFGKGRKDVSADGVVALAVVLRHLATPERLDRQAGFWGKSVAWVSKIFHATLDILYIRALSALRRWPQFHFQDIKKLCEVMSERSGNLLYAHSLIDGSGIRICRPSGDGPTGPEQQHYYSGKERYHVLRILGLFSLTGVMIRLFGIYPGSAADETIFRLDSVEEQLDQLHGFALEMQPSPKRPTIIGDSGFTASRNIVTPFSFDPASSPFSPENVYNMVLSRCRIPNEWGFGRVVNLFQTLEFTRSQKKGWTDPHKQYVVSCFMTNFVVIFEGSQTSSYFGLSPPSFDEYAAHIRKSSN